LLSSCICLCSIALFFWNTRSSRIWLTSFLRNTTSHSIFFFAIIFAFTAWCTLYFGFRLISPVYRLATICCFEAECSIICIVQILTLPFLLEETTFWVIWGFIRSAIFLKNASLPWRCSNTCSILRWFKSMISNPFWSLIVRYGILV